MKSPSILTLGSVAFLAASCGDFGNFGGPLSSNIDPLSMPGSPATTSSASVVGPTYQPGQWVETVMPNAAFFRSIPKGSARGDKILPVSTPMKVIATKESYLKVELDSGEVGYVPEIMVIARGSGESSPTIPDYGPIPPPVDPSQGAPGEIPPANPNGTPPPPPPGVVPEGAPDVPGVPAPPVPDPAPPVPEPAEPSAEDDPAVAPPPTVPGITD